MSLWTSFVNCSRIICTGHLESGITYAVTSQRISIENSALLFELSQTAVALSIPQQCLLLAARRSKNYHIQLVVLKMVLVGTLFLECSWTRDYIIFIHVPVKAYLARRTAL